MPSPVLADLPVGREIDSLSLLTRQQPIGTANVRSVVHVYA